MSENWGKSAIPSHKINIIPQPFGQSAMPTQFSGGPTFDLTPKDQNLSCDELPSPYGPPYGKQNGG